MTAYLIDADCAIFVTTGQYPSLRARLAELEPNSVGLSAISYAEIVVGMNRGKPPTPTIMSRFLRVVPLLAFDQAAADAYGSLPFKRARFDRLLAAHALSIGAVVITNNEADFADMPGLKVENWTV